MYSFLVFSVVVFIVNVVVVLVVVLVFVVVHGPTLKISGHDLYGENDHWL